jgi:hypothetical protein
VHTTGLPHTAHRQIDAHTAVYTAALQCELLHTAAHCKHWNARQLHTAHSRTPQLTCIKLIVCECTCIYMNLRGFVWSYMDSHEYNQCYSKVRKFTWILILLVVWFYLIIFQIIWFIHHFYEFMRICFEFIWIYAHCRTVTHCRTTGQPRTLPHALPDSRSLPRTLPHCQTLLCALLHTAAHCCTLHEYKYRTPRTAYCTPHKVAHHK